MPRVWRPLQDRVSVAALSRRRCFGARRWWRHGPLDGMVFRRRGNDGSDDPDEMQVQMSMLPQP